MANDVRSSRTAMRGLFICDDRADFDEAQSTLTEAGPRPGIPVAQIPSDLVLEATGTCAEEATYTIDCVKAGIPSRTDDGCRVTFTKGGVEHGWNPPMVPSGWEILYAAGGSDSLDDVIAMDACSMPDGSLLVVYLADDSYTVYAKSLSAQGVWGSAVFVTEIDAATERFGGVALSKLPSGRTLAFVWAIVGDAFQIITLYTDDYGATWARASSGALNDPLRWNNTEGPGQLHYFYGGQLRACYHNGQILLLASVRVADDDVSPGCRDVVVQFASRDGGASFSTIYEGDPFTVSVLLGGQYDCDVVDGRIVVTWASVTGSAPPYSAILTSPFESLADAETQVISADFGCADVGSAATSGGEISEADCSMCVDDDGVIYVFCTAYSEAQEAVVVRSVDGGESWETMGLSSTLSFEAGPWWNAHTSTEYPTHTCAVAHRGQIILLHGWKTAATTYTEFSMAVAYLGGWSSQTTPYYVQKERLANRAGYDDTWYGTVQPTSTGWTASGTGTSTLGATGLAISTFASLRSFSQIFTTTISEGIRFRAALSVSSGGVGTEIVRIGCDLDNGASGDRGVICRVGTAAVAVYDTISGVLQGTVSVNTTSGVEIIGVVLRDVIRISVRATDRSSPQTWEVVEFTPTSGAGLASSRVYWGHATLSTASSVWTEVHVSAGDYVAGDGPVWRVDEDTVAGRPLPPVPVYLDDGLYLRGRAGPGFTGDQWALTPSYDFGVERIDPLQHPSPRVRWRSQDDADDVYLAYTLQDTSITDEPGMRSPLMGLVVLGANWDSGEIQGRNSAGTWSTIYEIDASEGLGPIHFSCQGSTVRPNSSSGTNPFFKTNELSGSTLSMGSGIFRKIRSNSGGRWSTGGGQQAVIILDEVDGSEPSTGTTGAIHPKDFAVIINQSATQGYRGLRLWIEGGQGTADGYFEIGTLAWGHIEVFGDEYSWDRTVETQPSIDRSVASDGTDRVRVLAPPIRIARVAWPNPVNTTPLYSQSEPEPDFLTGSSLPGAAAVASIGATAYQVEALTTITDSGRIPVAYIPKLPFGGATSNLQVQLLNRRDQFIWGRFLGGVSLETSMGEELDNEMVRASQIEIEELP